MKRTLLLHLSALIFPFGLLADTGPYFGNALKIGEVTQDSAIIWTRLTQTRFFNTQGRSWIEYPVDIRSKEVRRHSENGIPQQNAGWSHTGRHGIQLDGGAGSGAPDLLAQA